jgi:tetratricopeptide (TPR) repeat protein
MDLTLFNPRSQSEQDFIASFVARQSTLEFFLRQLRQLGPEQAARHQLIVAPRGFGKTSLLRRIAIAVRAEATLRERYLPLSFREEQHNVISLDVFWRNCLQALLEAREEERASDAELESIDAAWTRLTPRAGSAREAQDGEPALQDFRSRCSNLGRRPILLIDNLDTLLAGLSSDHQWTLRETLQQADGPVLVAAASRYPESTHDAAAAFYEFFRIHTLDRLENAEVLLCLKTLALHRGELGKPVLALLERDPGRVAALNTLAGGNPRTLGVLYGVLESHMSTDVLSQLSAMLDTFTGWYQARTEELPMQARAVFDALALNWDPMTAAAVSQTTGLATAAVSSQLSRLEKLGYVEAVALSRRGKGRSGYQVAERFFNIWYLMRNGPRRARQSIKFLTVFLQSCFSATERRSMGRTILDSGCADPGYAVALAATIRDQRLRESLLEWAQSESLNASGGGDYQTVIRELLPGAAQASGSEPRDFVDNVRRNDALNREDVSVPSPAESKAATEESVDASSEIRKGLDLARQGQYADAIAVFDRAVARFGESPEAGVRERVAGALVNKGIALGQLGRSEEEVLVYDSLVARFGGAPEAGLREQVAMALVYKGITLGQLGRIEEEVRVYDNVVARFGEAPVAGMREWIAMALVNKAVRLGQRGRSEEAVLVYDSLVAHFGDAPEMALRGGIGRALVNKGITLGQLGRSEEAVLVFDSVFARFGDAPEAALRELAARALAIKGFVLGQLGRIEEEVQIYDIVVTRFGEAPEAALREQVATALVNKGVRLSQLGRIEEAMQVCDSVVARFGGAPEAALREQVAKALVNKGVRLGQLGRADEAMGVYENVVARFGEAPEAALRDQVARALVNQSVTLGRLGRVDEAMRVCDSMVAHFGEAPESTLREQVAKALLDKGVKLVQLGRVDEAMRVYDDVVARLGEAPEAALREQVARALVNKGIALGQLGRNDEATRVYDNVVARFSEATEATLREAVARALVNLGIALGQLGRSDEEILVCDSVVARFGEATESSLRAQVARALVNKGIALGQLGRNEEEVRVYDSVVARFIDAPEAPLREGTARALVNKGIVLRQLGRSDEAVRVYESVVARFGDAPEAALREQVAQALQLAGQTRMETGQLDAAEADLRKAIKQNPQQANLWTSLGNLLLDYRGVPEAAETAYREGILVAEADDDLAILHANSAYVLALHLGNQQRAKEHIQRAMAIGASGLDPAGQALLSALADLSDAGEAGWTAMFSAIDRAVDSGDPTLWTSYLDDLQRLLSYALIHNQGDGLRRWMEIADYPLRQAPLYHALVAAIEGEDHLLTINPETRTPAERIYEGIARRQKLYAGSGRVRKRT